MGAEQILDITPPGNSDLHRGPQMGRRDFLGLSFAAIAAPDMGLKIMGSLTEAASIPPQIESEKPRHPLDMEPVFQLINEMKTISPEDAHLWDNARANVEILDREYRPLFDWAQTLSVLNDDREKDPARKFSIKKMYKEVFLGNIPEELVPSEAVVPFYATRNGLLNTKKSVIYFLNEIKAGKQGRGRLPAQMLQGALFDFLEREATALTPDPEFVGNYDDDKVDYKDDVAIISDKDIPITTAEGRMAAELDAKIVRESFIPYMEAFHKNGVRILVLTLSDRYGEATGKAKSFLEGLGGRISARKNQLGEVIQVIWLNMDIGRTIHPDATKHAWFHEISHGMNPITGFANVMKLPPEYALDMYQTAGEVMTNPDWGIGKIGIGKDVLSTMKLKLADRFEIFNDPSVETPEVRAAAFYYPANAIFSGPSGGYSLQFPHTLGEQSHSPDPKEQLLHDISERAFGDWNIAPLDSLPQQFDLQDGMFANVFAGNTYELEEGEAEGTGPEPMDVFPLAGLQSDSIATFREFAEQYLPELDRAGKSNPSVRVLAAGIRAHPMEVFDNYEIYANYTLKDGTHIIPAYTKKTWEDWKNYTDVFVWTSILYDMTFNQTQRLVNEIGVTEAAMMARQFIQKRTLAALEYDAELGGFYHTLGPRLKSECPKETEFNSTAHIFKYAI